MTTTESAAIAYAVLAIAPIAVQLALAAGAPLGHLTLGGRWPRRLPPAIRIATLVQAALLTTMALAVLTAGGVIDFAPARPLFWPTLALTALSLVANAASPSRPERLLWVPVIFLMLASATIVAFGRT